MSRMKKTTLLLAALLTFMVFAFAGFLLAVRADSLARLPLARRIALQDRQNNLVLIQVSDLEAQQPALRSIWVALRFRSDNQTALTFIRLYPNTDDLKSGEKLADAFGLTNTNEPAPVFMRALEASGVRFSGYLLVDDTGMEQVAAWVRQVSPKANTSGDAQLLESGCLALNTANSATLPPFDWASFSGHLNTNLAFDDIMVEWNRLTTPQSPLRCELASQ